MVLEEKNNQKLNIETLSDGFYFIKLLYAKNQHAIMKFIKK